MLNINNKEGKYMKKLLCAVLSIILCFGALTACGPKDFKPVLEQAKKDTTGVKAVKVMLGMEVDDLQGKNYAVSAELAFINKNAIKATVELKGEKVDSKNEIFITNDNGKAFVYYENKDGVWQKFTDESASAEVGGATDAAENPFYPAIWEEMTQYLFVPIEYDSKIVQDSGDTVGEQKVDSYSLTLDFEKIYQAILDAEGAAAPQTTPEPGSQEETAMNMIKDIFDSFQLKYQIGTEDGKLHRIVFVDNGLGKVFVRIFNMANELYGGALSESMETQDIAILNSFKLSAELTLLYEEPNENLPDNLKNAKLVDSEKFVEDSKLMADLMSLEGSAAIQDLGGIPAMF